MGLVLTQRKGVYYVRGRVHGKPVYKTTGTREAAEAERIRAKIEADLVAEFIEGPSSVVTFDHAAYAYVKDGGKSHRIVHEDSKGNERGLLRYFTGKRLKDITQVDLDRCAEKQWPNASPETRNREVYTPFIAVWNFAVQNEWAKARTWRRPRAKVGTGIRKQLRAGTSPVSYETAWAFVRHMSPAAAGLVTFLFYTGMRPIEAFSLLRSDINIADRWIVIGNSKTGEPRGVPMHELLVPLLSALQQRDHADPHLFMTQKNAPYAEKDEGEGGGQMKSAVIGARKRSGIKTVAPYTARHTVSTQLVLNGVHPYVKDQILGHAVTDMSRRYTQVPQKPLIEAINTLPIITEWAKAEWLIRPLETQRRLARKVVKK